VSEADTITVLLHAHLRHYNGGEEELRLPHQEGSTVQAYLDSLAIPQHEYMGVVLDGTLTGDLSLVPAAGAVLELVPAMSGG